MEVMEVNIYGLEIQYYASNGESNGKRNGPWLGFPKIRGTI